ncbi:unnamed protein product [Phyllotreta striolata]|uniref:Uncharacterized protein n=1 Tax=Phyllotreta striolata TaxID=444603 RepID=A0A9P0DQT7_PHYSR|nr:unnamed protein product [Phyllotreta striolata]
MINESRRQHRGPEYAKTAVPASASAGTSRRAPVATLSSLEMEMDERYFRSGKARFRCAVAIFDLYERETERVVEEDRPKPRPSSVLGNRDTSAGLFVGPTRVIFLLVFFVYCLR